MATQTQAPPQTAEDFEAIYTEADGNASLIPWVDGQPSTALVNWLNVVAPSLVRCGARVAVVACALGDDARELIRRGYDVVAFDCSETAVDWAKRLDPMNASAYHVADLMDLPSRWNHRFDLVVEIDTLESMVPEQRREAMQPLADMLGRHGRLLVICRAADEPADEADGPPWPLTKQELLESAEAAGLKADEPVSVFEDDEQTPPVLRMRALFSRAE